eukprot:6175574-Pleurochrysis_carterae.AAC.4
MDDAAFKSHAPSAPYPTIACIAGKRLVVRDCRSRAAPQDTGLNSGLMVVQPDAKACITGLHPAAYT